MTAAVVSIAALVGGTAYTASKHGVGELINQLACEFATQRVGVNGVAPGAIRTNIARDMSDMTSVDQPIKAATPLGRWRAAEEIAGPVLFLACNEASFITIALLCVDGGWRSK